MSQSSLIDSFRRSPRGGAEQQQYNDPEDMVTTTILAPMSDRLVWSLESSGEFTVTLVRKLIDDKWLSGADNKTRWIKYVPIKINVHAWKVMSDSNPTRFNISRRGISIDSLSCVFYAIMGWRHLIICFFPVALSDKCLGSLCDGGTFLRLNLSRTLDGWIGLQINGHKCQLLGVGVPNNVVQQASDSIGCSILNNHVRYLGMMVGDNMSRLKAWDVIILKIKSRLSK
uniref:RNA-directed DNA polymerase, eukaryota n=1 Tax=Tanacetum cinerariifolium TaxID=118510 RepID=A0A699GJW4_TANCI|nr:RNA-directed DNA polymerase, eukaryota [Tanacetum cinerariifolium]